MRWLAFVFLGVLWVLCLNACNERWGSPTDKAGCDLANHPTLSQRDLWSKTFASNGWAVACLRVESPDTNIVFTKPVRLAENGQVWGTDSAEPASMQFRLPDELRGAKVSFRLLVAGNAGQGRTDLVPFCNVNFTKPQQECEKDEQGLCWFEVKLQLSLGDGTFSLPIEGHNDKKCHIDFARGSDEGNPDESNPGESNPGEVIVIDGGVSEPPPQTCAFGTTERCSTLRARPEPTPTPEPPLPQHCYEGTRRCANDFTWGPCEVPPAPREVCGNAIDDNCDGKVDEGCPPGSCAPTDCIETVAGNPHRMNHQDGEALQVAAFHQPQDVLFVEDPLNPAKSSLYVLEARSRGNTTSTLLRKIKDGVVSTIEPVDLSTKKPSSAFVLQSPKSLARITKDTFWVVDAEVIKNGSTLGYLFWLSAPTLPTFPEEPLFLAQTTLSGSSYMTCHKAKGISECFLSNQNTKSVYRQVDDGKGKFTITPFLTSPTVGKPSGLAVAGDFLYIADVDGHCIRAVEINSKDVVVLAGSCGSSGFVNESGANARFKEPKDIELDPAKGLLYVADTGNSCIRAISLETKQVSTLAGQCNIPGYTPQKTTRTGARFLAPTGLSLGTDGYLYMTDTGNHFVRKILLP